jgi:hypothetical protein
MLNLKIYLEEDKLLTSEDMSCAYKLINEALAFSGLSQGKRRELRSLGGKLWALDSALTMAMSRNESKAVPTLHAPQVKTWPAFNTSRIEQRSDGTIVIRAPAKC